GELPVDTEREGLQAITDDAREYVGGELKLKIHWGTSCVRSDTAPYCYLYFRACEHVSKFRSRPTWNRRNEFHLIRRVIVTNPNAILSDRERATCELKRSFAIRF